MFAGNSDNELKSTAEIIIHVIDINDNAPQFAYAMSETLYTSVTVQEDILIGSEIVKIFAFDNDTTHEEIIFSLSGGNIGHDFKITSHFDSTNEIYYGSISTQHELDHDNGPSSYLLKVRISDGVGFGDANTNDIDVEIMVNDVNDNAPVFDEDQYSITIAETTRSGTRIMSSKITDMDQLPVYTFRLAESANMMFNISYDGGNFNIGVIASLVGYGGQRFNLVVIASDSVYETEAAVQVNVEDINLHAPKIRYKDELPASVTVIVEENHNTFDPFITVYAEDEDQGQNGMVQFRIKIQVSNTFVVKSGINLVRIISDSNPGVNYIDGEMF